MLTEFNQYYDETLKDVILEKLSKIAFYQKTIREFFCIADDTKIESFLMFLIDLNSRHGKVVDKLIQKHLNK